MSGFMNSKEGIIRSLLAVTVSVFVNAALLLISCAILLMTKDPGSLVRPVSVGVMYGGAFVSGVISVRMTGKTISGAVTGAALTLILFLISAIFFDEETDGALSLLLHAAVVVCAYAGSLAGRIKKDKRSRLKKIRKRK